MKGMVRSVVAGGAIALLAAPPAAEAQRWRWLDTSPVRAFTESDWEVVRSAAREALDTAEEGETVGWQNEGTGASGTITLRGESEHEGLPCREAKFFNSADGLTGTAIHRLCKIADGSWRIAP